MPDNIGSIEEKYRETMAAFSDACRRAGRSEDEVKMIAVSKTFPAESVKQAYRLGQRLFGENYVQELCEKEQNLPKDIEWHFIGRLQRNKVKYIIDKAVMIHSVDSPVLAREISRQALLKNREARVLLQVNLGAEESKAGFEREALRRGLEEIAELPGLQVLGLMTIGPYYDNPEDARALFREMRALKAEVASWAVKGIVMQYLSMGMSHDYTIAIEEGADFVRVGSAIFGQR
ncbi:MAG: YggS family pyridoxal phosphate-dependent enzyme [Clostridiales bacterium]|nr:YggS family pyridoxal phosphate-dependent enzyme [Clostridiales bacterium]